MELVLDRVSKQYGNKIAVDRISTIFRPGVIGLLGANGAGKTTLMRMICGILRPTDGTICFKDGAHWTLRKNCTAMRSVTFRRISAIIRILPERTS